MATSIKLEPRTITAATKFKVRCMVPLMVWHNVDLEFRSEHKLSILERFAIEALLELNTCTIDELSEITSINHHLGNWLLNSLEQRGLAKRDNDNQFSPQSTQCLDALKLNVTSVIKQEKRTLLWFPESSDIVVLDLKNDEVLRALSSVNPVRNYPIDRNAAQANRARLINKAIENKQLAGNQVFALVRAAESSITTEKFCPAYDTVVDIRQVEHETSNLCIFSHLRRKDQKSETCSSIILSRLLGLEEKLKNEFKENIKEVATQKNKQGFTDLTYSNGILKVGVDGKKAEELSGNGTINIESQACITFNEPVDYILPALLSPSDEKAKYVMVIDEIIQRLLSADTEIEDLDITLSEYRINKQLILDRLWSLKLYKNVYDIREQEDFSI